MSLGNAPRMKLQGKSIPFCGVSGSSGVLHLHSSRALVCVLGRGGGMTGCREGRGQRCPPDSYRAPQLWAARREWIGNGCSVNLPSPNCCSVLGLVLWQRRGHISPTLLLPYTRDLWRCKFCLAFPESQFGDLCWRRPWKGSLVAQAAFQA